MDSRVVSKELWKVLRPLFKEAGWSSFTSRTARRFGNARIDVINFQSFNSYLAEMIGCTTYSFSVRLGCFFPVIPHSGIKVKDGLLMPEEYHCHLRRTLYKKFSQPECPRADVFYVDPEGKYFPAIVGGVQQEIASEGMAWFQRFSDTQEVLRTLMEDDVRMEGTWGFGRKSSPIRNLYTGYIALSLGKAQIAKDCLTQAASVPVYARFREQIEADLSNLK
jgi:hypothetical protein